MTIIDLLDYLRGDGRLYEIVNNWGSTTEVVQTHRDDSGDLKVFYQVKNNQWEELWADDVFIYRGTDTSPGSGEAYTLSENSVYGSAWCPRYMKIGDAFRRAPMVTFRRKSDGSPVGGKPPFQQVTWLRLVALHDRFKFQSGLEIADVIELQGYLDGGNRPAPSAFEKYYYARGYGLVAWEDPNSGWKSWIAQTFTPQVMPQRTREPLTWLSAIRNRLLTVPKLPSVTPHGSYIVEKTPSDFINIRAYPTLWGKDVGDLRKGDQVTVYLPEVNGWVLVESPYARGWISMQNGAVGFTAASQPASPTLPPTGEEPDPIGEPIPPDIDPEPLPPDELPPTSFVWPGTLEDAIRMRDAYRQVEEGARRVREELDNLIEMMQ